MSRSFLEEFSLQINNTLPIGFALYFWKRGFLGAQKRFFARYTKAWRLDNSGLGEFLCAR
jgi:hypothetical protein